MSTILEVSHHSSPEASIIKRRDSPGSLRSQDSGFSDSDHSSPNTSGNSNHTKISPIGDNRNCMKPTPSKLTPKTTINYKLNDTSRCSSADRSPSMCSDAHTPPTVIRKHPPSGLNVVCGRRISYSNSAPSSPISPSELKSINLLLPKSNNSSLNDGNLADVSMQSNSSSAKINRSLRRSRNVTPENGESYRRLSQRKLLTCVSQVSGSIDDVYMVSTATASTLDVAHVEQYQPNGDEHIYETVASLSGAQIAEQQTPKKSAAVKMHTTTPYHNETVVFGIEPTPQKQEPPPREANERLPLPTYDELYPNGTSTPKLLGPNARQTIQMSKTLFQTPIAKPPPNHVSLLDRTRNRLFSGEMDLDVDLSLSAAINWETCTYIEYTNPLLNGHASSVQFWLDETRATFCHEILSTLQTKSVLHEAARSLKINAAIAAKLIHQIQLKAMHIEGNFDEITSVFVAHARVSRGNQCGDNATHNDAADNTTDDAAYLAEDQFKDIIPNLVRQLISNVCLFMSKLNSRVIFQSVDGAKYEPGELRYFEKSVKTVVEMSQDLQVACETKIDDIEAHKLLEDLQSLKHCVLKTVRKIYRRLVNIIITRIETNTNDMLLQASVNLISSLPLEGDVYHKPDSFASLSKAFLDTGAIRVLLLVCLDTDQTSIRTMALRALATICATSEMIDQFLDMDGIDVVANLLLDERKTGDEYEPELREAVSVLTQVTAPWHLESHVAIDDFLRVSVDKMVTRITALLERTDDVQMFMLCTACINNFAQKTDLAFYSLMANRSIQRIRGACDALARHPEFINSRVFVYVSVLHRKTIHIRTNILHEYLSTLFLFFFSHLLHMTGTNHDDDIPYGRQQKMPSASCQQGDHQFSHAHFPNTIPRQIHASARVNSQNKNHQKYTAHIRATST